LTVQKYNTVGTVQKYNTVATVEKYNTVGTIQKFNTKIIERGKNRYFRNACWWFSHSALVSSTNNTDRHDITEILLKVALNTIKPNI
jgi:hypothetical protein